jgi:hypothetical protein
MQSMFAGIVRRTLALALLGVLAAASVLPAAGCSATRMTGVGRFHDISKVKKGMDQNDVAAIMGGNYKLVMEEGLEGMDMGIYIWDYPEGRVYFNSSGVMKVLAK